ncbi:MAG: DUF1445 domain-containing protein [Planctomycetota bacterium]|nr:MAG: DUF1445 domain-containing protein [Planctomycetota bacterium]
MNNFSYITPKENRALIRGGKYTQQTSGMSMGYLQVNVVILPKDFANDFQKYCVNNSKACPLLEVTDVGSIDAGKLATEVDVRVDLPKYQIFKNGLLVDSPDDILNYWQDDFVTFYLGCSFSFEDKLLEEGFKLRHIVEGRNVPMYKSNLPCASVGPFKGNMVVSMRPFLKEDISKVSQITKEFSFAHGDPIHMGDPEAIGIGDINNPDFGDAVTINSNEIPVFWACGVTALEAVKSAKLDIAITHAPGCMLICDVLSDDLQGNR